MIKKINAAMISVILLLTTLGVETGLGQGRTRARKNYDKVEKIGVRKKVKVELPDGSGFKGKIESYGKDNFTVKNKNLDSVKTFSYEEVKKVKSSSITKWVGF